MKRRHNTSRLTAFAGSMPRFQLLWMCCMCWKKEWVFHSFFVFVAIPVFLAEMRRVFVGILALLCVGCSCTVLR